MKKINGLAKVFDAAVSSLILAFIGARQNQISCECVENNKNVLKT